MKLGITLLLSMALAGISQPAMAACTVKAATTCGAGSCFQIPSDGACYQITGADAVCENVTNTAGFQIFIPNNSNAEWQSFYAHPPSSVSVVHCNSPTVTSISPNVGLGAGGTTITVTGTFFENNMTASVGGVACTTSTYVNVTTMTCVTPANATITASNITVLDPDQSTATLLSAYTYVGSPSLWLKGSLGVTSAAGAVSAWADQSGNANNATQATGADQPSVTASSASFNNQQVITFSGAPKTMTLAKLGVLNGVNGWGWVVAARTSNKAVNESIMIYSVGTSASSRMKATITQTATEVGSTTGDMALAVRRLDADTLEKISGGTITNNTAFSAAGTVDYTAKAGTLRFNRVTVSTSSTVQTAGSASATNSQQADIGSNAGAENWTGDIAEVFLYARTLTVAEITVIENYLQALYALP